MVISFYASGTKLVTVTEDHCYITDLGDPLGDAFWPVEEFKVATVLLRSEGPEEFHKHLLRAGWKETVW